MQLKELLEGLDILSQNGDTSIEIDSIVNDSRKACQGSLFVCIEGYATDGHKYIAQAQKLGASAVLLQKSIAGLTVPWAQIPDTRRGLAHVSDRFFGHPSGCLELIGITGTKGKTTASYMTKEIFAAADRKTGLIGTVENNIGDEVNTASCTTPEANDLQRILGKMVSRGMDSCVMEVSSQGLMLDRVYGCEYSIGVFTNLYHDHIGPNEHASMEEYLSAKLKLFALCHQAVINRDVDCYKKVRDAISGPCLTFGLTAESEIRATGLKKIVKYQRNGTCFKLSSPWYNGEIFVGMPGRFNVYNALAAIACAGHANLPFTAVLEGLAQIEVPGRIQTIPTNLPFQVIVDYAHNAASLENLLETLREYVSGQLIVVFGCGGDRSHSRRADMGGVASRLADLVVITSDNPRSEDPIAIINDILAGISLTGNRCMVINDRKEAIEIAIRQACPGDMVVIAGKGHEKYQILKNNTIYFDDVKIAADTVAAIEESKNI